MRQIITNVIYGVFALVEVMLGLRLVLRLLGANGENGFVQWVYESSASILDPFSGIFPVRVYESTFVLEFSTLFAMILYAIIAMLLVWLINVITEPIEKQINKKR